MDITEVELTREIEHQLIAFSHDWEEENSCYGYRANTRTDLEGNRFFMAMEQGQPIGYLFGKAQCAKDMRSIMPDGTPYFEVEELYVAPPWRSKGVGRALFQAVSEAAAKEADYLMLSTATKNWRAILHFYIEELGMEFWNARLFKRLS